MATPIPHTASSSTRWPLPRWRQSFLWTHLVFRPSRRDFEYLTAFRTLLAARQLPTLQRLAERLDVRRQTVWQREQQPGFREWLTTEILLWRRGVASREIDGTLHPSDVDVVAELLSVRNGRGRVSHDYDE